MAGEPEVVGGIVVPITADTSGLEKGLGDAKSAVEGHTGVWREAAGVITGILGVELLGQVKNFVVQSVHEYVKLDLALDRTSRTLQKLGGTYAQAREKVEKYADSVEALTQFSDEEATTSINQIMLRTHDWTRSMQINALAMDIVSRKGGDLASTANMLTLAYSGHPRGLMQISRQLGIVGPASKDAGLLFRQMEKDFKGAAAGSTNAYTEFSKLKNEVENLSEAVGKAAMPAAQAISVMVRSLLGSEEAKLIGRIDGFKKMAADLRKNAEFGSPAIQAKQRAEAEIWGNKAIKLETDLARLRKNQLADSRGLAEAAAKKQQALRDEERALEKLKKIEDQRRDKAQRAATAQGEALQKVKDEQEALAKTLVGPVSQNMQEFFSAVLNGTAKMEQAFEALAKAIGKSLLNVLATALEQMAAVQVAKGLAALATVIEAPAAPGFFAAGAIEATAAGGIRAVAASLAEGGVVHAAPGGHIVQVAEGGQDEVVSPLSTLKGMFGGGTNNISLSFPNVTSSADLNQGQMATAARRLLGEMQRVKSRSGNAYSRI